MEGEEVVSSAPKSGVNRHGLTVYAELVDLIRLQEVFSTAAVAVLSVSVSAADVPDRQSPVWLSIRIDPDSCANVAVLHAVSVLGTAIDGFDRGAGVRWMALRLVARSGRSALGPARTWGLRLARMLHRDRELRALSLWISTLGGAYSALGDNNLMFAEEAEALANRQRRVALALDDPGLARTCEIFVAFAAIQQKDFVRAARIIEASGTIATAYNDAALGRMCVSAAEKLMYSLRKHSGKATSIDGDGPGHCHR